LALRTVPIGAVVLVMVIGPSVAVGGTVAVSFVAETNVTALAATPLNFTVELLVKPTPVSVTTVPAGPLVGAMAVIDSVGVKFAALVALPAAVVTEILPATAALGTVAVICVADSTLYDAARPANFTLLAPLKFVPVIVTLLPVIAEVGVNELTVGATCGVTV
jgi:hypothetical protein